MTGGTRGSAKLGWEMPWMELTHEPKLYSRSHKDLVRRLKRKPYWLGASAAITALCRMKGLKLLSPVFMQIRLALSQCPGWMLVSRRVTPATLKWGETLTWLFTRCSSCNWEWGVSDSKRPCLLLLWRPLLRWRAWATGTSLCAGGQARCSSYTAFPGGH